MSKQKEIREGVAKMMAEAHGCIWKALSDKSIDKAFYRQEAKSQLEYLHSQGAVIKVERAAPFVLSNYELSQRKVYVKIGNEALSEQGYVASMPLIEVAK